VSVPRILVAGIGNIFLGDDAFGSEVAQRLLRAPLPPGVRVVDYGVRGLHLAYDLLEGGYHLTILADLLPRGGTPGTVYLMEPDVGLQAPPETPDAHTMSPASVFGALRALGGHPGRTLIVGCEPASLEEGAPLSEAVEAALDDAVALVNEVIARERGEGGSHVSGNPGAARASVSR
jgi:hydrogenase maturation protease